MKKTNDPLGLSAVIHAAFPVSLIRYCDNFDDCFHGWEICPIPGVLIVFNVRLGDDFYIKIEKKVIKSYSNDLIVKDIFKGNIPCVDDGPDLDFIKKVLINWNSF